jgi:hypothetical protein
VAGGLSSIAVPSLRQKSSPPSGPAPTGIRGRRSTDPQRLRRGCGSAHDAPVHIVDTRPLRLRAAEAARDLIAGRIEWDDFAAEFGDVRDPKVSELIDLIEREPEVGGFSGVTHLQYRAYRATIERLLAELEREA